MRKIFYLLTCCLLTACSANITATKEKPTETAVAALSHQQLRTALAGLSGAQVSETEPLIVNFPVGTMFAQGSVLPMPGGAGLVDGLAELLKKSGLSWRLVLRAETGEGEEYDAALAAERARVLKAYLKSFGLNMRKIYLTSKAESGAPLSLQVKQ